MTTATRMFNRLWSSSTAVFVSLRDNARALLSLNALTWKKKKQITHILSSVNGSWATENLFCFSKNLERHRL